MTDLRLCRSLLFLPAANPRAIEKARGLAADLIILDLEDSVREEDKEAAREAAAATDFGDRPLAIRVNAAGTRHHPADLACAAAAPAKLVVLAKADSAGEVEAVARATGKKVLAMIETPRAVLDAAAIAQVAAALIAGTNDLSAALNLPARDGRPGLVHALQAIVLAARAAGIPAFDGVHNRLEADGRLAAECDQGRDYGFDGKSVIHPSQIEAANRAFTPDEAEIEAASRLIAAATGGAERHDGRMIEAMHVAEAKALLAKARR